MRGRLTASEAQPTQTHSADKTALRMPGRQEEKWRVRNFRPTPVLPIGQLLLISPEAAMTAPRVGILKAPVSEPRGLINSTGQRPLCAMAPERKMVGGGLSAPPTGASDWTFYNCVRPCIPDWLALRNHADNFE